MNKVIIYLNGASKESGLLVLKLRVRNNFQCPPGGYIGFQNSKTEHGNLTRIKHREAFYSTLILCYQ